MDGALFYNCPVRVAFHEQQLIWNDASSSLPDLLVSIGTGSAGPEDLLDNVWDPAFATEHNLPLLKKWFKTVQNRLEDLLDCRRTWNHFLADNVYNTGGSTLMPIDVLSESTPTSDNAAQRWMT
jgi:hypothetical protein